MKETNEFSRLTTGAPPYALSCAGVRQEVFRDALAGAVGPVRLRQRHALPGNPLGQRVPMMRTTMPTPCSCRASAGFALCHRLLHHRVIRTLSSRVLAPPRRLEASGRAPQTAPQGRPAHAARYAVREWDVKTPRRNARCALRCRRPSTPMASGRCSSDRAGAAHERRRLARSLECAGPRSSVLQVEKTGDHGSPCLIARAMQTMHHCSGTNRSGSGWAGGRSKCATLALIVTGCVGSGGRSAMPPDRARALRRASRRQRRQAAGQGRRVMGGPAS